jgi:hypothetical protein
MPKRKLNQFQVSSSAQSLDSPASPKQPRTNENAPLFSKFPRVYFWLNHTAESEDFDPVDSSSHADIEGEGARSDVAESIGESIRGLVEEAKIQEDNSESDEDYDGVTRTLFARQGVVNEGETCLEEGEDQRNHDSGNSSSALMDTSEMIDQSVRELVEEADLLGKTASVARKLFADRGVSNWGNSYDFGSEFEQYDMEGILAAVSGAVALAAGVHQMHQRKRIQNCKIAATKRQRCHRGLSLTRRRKPSNASYSNFTLSNI